MAGKRGTFVSGRIFKVNAIKMNAFGLNLAALIFKVG